MAETEPLTETPPVVDRLRAAGDEFKAVRDSLAQTRAALQPVMVEALRAGVPQKDVIELSGYTRESVRTIARNAGIEPNQAASGAP
jgi:hypothetical protein